MEQGGSIKTTREYIGSRNININPTLPYKEFKPNIFFKSIVLIFVLGIFAIAVFKTFQPKSLTNSEIGGLSVAYIVSFILGVNVIRQFFVDKTMNYKIRVDNSGITVADTLYEWAKIHETAILIKFSGKGGYNYLVIGMDNMSTYESFDLTNFTSLYPFGFSMKLSKYIEYFKSIKR